jgi:UrcA family protein
MTKLSRVAAMSLLAGAFLSTGPAFAADPEAPSRLVSYADLNLSSPAGMARLNRRIASAVEAVCGSYAGTVSVAEEQDITRCRTETTARLQPQLATITGRSTVLASR